jgi:hypothetical protein
MDLPADLIAFVVRSAVGIAAVIGIPVGLYTAFKIVGRVTATVADSLPEVPATAALEARLARMEDAIDAMSRQIEQLRTATDDRYVQPVRAAEARALPDSTDPPTFR